MSDKLDDATPADSVVAFRLTTDRRLRLQLEPRGMVYEIAPRNTVEIRVVPPQDPPEVVVKGDDLISVWCQGFAAVFIDGVDVDKRLPTKAEVVYFASDEYRDRWRRREDAFQFIESLRRDTPLEWDRIGGKVKERVQAGDMFGEAAKEAFACESRDLRIALRDAGILPSLEVD